MGKLIRSEVEWIRKKFKEGALIVDLADTMGVTPTTIQRIIRGTTWKKAEGPTKPTARGRGAQYSDAHRARINEFLVAGWSPRHVAARFKMSARTIYRWIAEAKEDDQLDTEKDEE